jgi:hypothetical protein
MDSFVYNILEGYNSDDEASEDEPVSYRQGLRAIGEIFKNALENRTSSKKALKNHRPEAAAPRTNDNKRRWYNMFMAFFQTLDLP